MRAIALQVIPTNDKGGVVRLFTEAHGLRAYYTSLGKKASLFQPMSLLDIEEREQRQGSMMNLREAQRAVVLQSVPFNPMKAAVALFMAELLNRSVAEDQVNDALFNYSWHSIEALDLDDRVSVYPILFLGRLLRFIGIAPPEAPGSQSAAKFLDLMHGEWLYDPPMHSQFLSAEESRVFSASLHVSQADFESLKLSRSQRRDLLDHLLRYLQIHMNNDREVKSYAILREVFS